jgi:hypothetical protein
LRVKWRGPTGRGSGTAGWAYNGTEIMNRGKQEWEGRKAVGLGAVVICYYFSSFEVGSDRRGIAKGDGDDACVI